MVSDHSTHRITWSVEDEEHVGRCADSRHWLVRGWVVDMPSHGEPIQAPGGGPTQGGQVTPQISI